MSKRKLLLADDSITIQKVVNLTFADEGIEVIAVGDGDTAMRKFDEFIPDLVMADVNMPGLNGYEVCRIIKLTEETKHIPVILLVGSFEPFDEAEAKDAGADDFLTKPFQSIRQLVNKVTDLLEQRAPVSETPESAAESELPSAPAADTFAETLEFEHYREIPAGVQDREEVPAEFGDAGMDDEMIETSPANDYVSDSGAGYQAETTADYAAAEPLDAEESKDFSLASGAAEQSAEDAFENREIHTQSAETGSERAEAATFDEEARKLGGNQIYEDSERKEEPPLIAENEPQVDYYLPAGEEEFEKEMTDAETLAPDVSYSAEQPREADFSQTETVGEFQAGPAAEETGETGETPYSAQENEAADFDKTLAFDQPAAEPSDRSEEYRESSETETAYAAETPIAESAGESGSREETVGDSTGEMETAEYETTWETPVYAPTNAAPLDFDDGDLLELPPLVEETGIRPQPKVQPPVSEPETAAIETTAEFEPETAAEMQPVGEIENMQSFPPELIEAIAQKVADKISSKTMNDILPQITELVMKKMAEERNE